jgi:hypothetical protein
MPGDSGVLVVTRVRSTTIIAHETAGAAGTRHSPRPHWGREIHVQLGRSAPRDRERASGIRRCIEIPRHCERSEAIHSFFARQDGLLRCARNDGLKRRGLR